MSRSIISKSMVGGKMQKVQYKSLGLICFHYGCIGHRDNVCDKVERDRAKVNLGTEDSVHENKGSESIEGHDS